MQKAWGSQVLTRVLRLGNRGPKWKGPFPCPQVLGDWSFHQELQSRRLVCLQSLEPREPGGHCLTAQGAHTPVPQRGASADLNFDSTFFKTIEGDETQ